MNSFIHPDTLPALIRCSIAAGAAILDIYEDHDASQVVDYKADDSPLTLADQAAHQVIVKALRRLPEGYPVISEESDQNLDYETRRDWPYFWLVDPLDGTKEFIRRNGEFTVNIALIHQGEPVLGVIYVPVQEVLFYGMRGAGAYRQKGTGPVEEIRVRERGTELVAVGSRSHAKPEEEALLAAWGITEKRAVGSSLKFCMIAEGHADLYYRHGPTMEWDTGAGQAVLEAAGGFVYSGNEAGRPFRYNKEDLRNGPFLCLGFAPNGN